MSAVSLDIQWKDIDGTIRSTTWKNGVREVSTPAFTGPSVEAVPSPHIFLNIPRSPLTYLRLFLPFDVSGLIVAKTNSCAFKLANVNMRSWRALKEYELYI